jgi:hypothetical protein
MKLATWGLVQLLTVIVQQAEGWNFVSLRPTQHRYSAGETVRQRHNRGSAQITQTKPRVVYATTSSDPGGSDTKGTKKKRRRKVAPPVANDSPSVSIDTSINGSNSIQREDTLRDPTLAIGDGVADDSSVTKEDLATLSEIAKFEFKRDTPTMDSSILRENLDTALGTMTTAPLDPSSVGGSSNALLLPDIKEARKRKQMEEEMARQQAQAEQKVKIKRSDKEAMRKVSSRIRGAAAAARWCACACAFIASSSFFVPVVFAISHCAGAVFVWRNVRVRDCSYWNSNPLPMPMIRTLRRKRMGPFRCCWANEPSRS